MTRNTKLFVISGLLVAVAVAVLVAPFASSSPDGLEKVAADEEFERTAIDHHLGDGPLADYQVESADSERLGTALSGVAGVLLTFGIGVGGFAVVGSIGAARRRDSGDGDGDGDGQDVPATTGDGAASRRA